MSPGRPLSFQSLPRRQVAGPPESAVPLRHWTRPNLHNLRGRRVLEPVRRMCRLRNRVQERDKRVPALFSGFFAVCAVRGRFRVQQSHNRIKGPFVRRPVVRANYLRRKGKRRRLDAVRAGRGIAKVGGVMTRRCITLIALRLGRRHRLGRGPGRHELERRRDPGPAATARPDRVGRPEHKQPGCRRHPVNGEDALPRAA